MPKYHATMLLIKLWILSCYSFILIRTNLISWVWNWRWFVRKYQMHFMSCSLPGDCTILFVFLSIFCCCRCYFFPVHVHGSHEFSEVRIALAIEKNLLRTWLCSFFSHIHYWDTLTSLSSLAEDKRLSYPLFRLFPWVGEWNHRVTIFPK